MLDSGVRRLASAHFLIIAERPLRNKYNYGPEAA
jgi:hypothetical protein